jgi:hypothetical protein
MLQPGNSYDVDKVACTHRTIHATQIQQREEKIAHQTVKFQDKTSLHIFFSWLATTPIPP